MTYLIIKAALSGVLIVLVSEVARRYPGVGGLITSLPLIAVLSILWLWRETSDADRIANYSQATFWFVLPSLPMFLALGPGLVPRCSASSGPGVYLSGTSSISAAPVSRRSSS
jgi:hypothetical protein